MRSISVIASLLLAAWLYSLGMGPGAAWLDVWWWRREAILFSGVLSFTLMAWLMLLAMRPAWLEQRMGGLDRLYRMHRLAGYWAIGLGFAHYLLELAGPLLDMLVPHPGKGPKVERLFEAWRDSAKDLGEWSIWLLGLLLVLTLWQRFPYHLWRYAHRLLAPLFLLFTFHGVVLAPDNYWRQPLGLLIAASALLGSICALYSLTRRIGQSRRHTGQIVAMRALADDVLEITCQLQGHWRHQPGQFAFIDFGGAEGAHPFTLSAADTGNACVRVAIKALGDHTRHLQHTLQVGQAVQVEGPYGAFTLPSAQLPNQHWIAAGIGVTPFLAWLEALQGQPERAPQATLHYCVRNPAEDLFGQRLAQLCSGLPSIRLQVHYSDLQGPLDGSTLLSEHPQGWPHLWFCGPQGLAEHLRRGLRQAGMPLAQFHQEAFRMR